MPIYWNMDASLGLYPLPDIIVVGDPSKPFEIQHQGCSVVNTVRILNLRLLRKISKNIQPSCNLL